jgi:hypothetical protein
VINGLSQAPLTVWGKGSRQMLGRRSFLISCGWLVTGPVLAKNNRPGTSVTVSLPPQMQTDETPLPAPVLHIEGWSTPFDSEQRPRSQVWISVNRSWRTAWR